MSKGRNASGRVRRRSAGQMYRAVTIPHAIKLNAMLTKNQSCGIQSVFLSEFQPLTVADRVIGALSRSGGVALAMACSRRHTFESVANWGADGNGRRSSRS